MKAQSDGVNMEEGIVRNFGQSLRRDSHVEDITSTKDSKCKGPAVGWVSCVMAQQGGCVLECTMGVAMAV
jgi:hypothetical protein